jgi:type IX secretion system PorP/SprF family membrane protein
MKKWFFIILFSGLISQIEAQQVPQYTHYIFNQFGINPAVAGIKECIDLRFGYRTQWMGFPGAPKTAFFSGNGRLKLRRAKDYRVYHGIGMMVENDVVGPFSRTMINFGYAYNMQVTSRHRLAFGIFGGFEQFRFNGTGLVYVHSDDEAISNMQTARIILPEFSPGVFFYSDEIFVGLTMKQLLRNRIRNVGIQTRLTHHYIINGGKKFKAGDKWAVIPNGMLKLGPMAPPALDLHLLFEYRNQLTLGAAWRNADALALLAKVNFLNHFSLAYAFDYTTSRIQLAGRNTHEVILGIYACPLKGASTWSCPTF